MPEARVNRSWLLWALLAVCLLPLVLPGDAPWINDEPQLLAQAEQFNQTPGHLLGIPLPFSIANRGLSGNHGAVYGPAAEWFYQLLLALVPHNLILLSAVRAAIVTLATAWALVWISRSAGLRFAFVPVLMLSPWMWFYSRQMWDNSLLIPLSALLLASYVGFLKTRSRAALMLAALCALLMPLIHLMAIAIVLPIALHLLLRETQWVLRFKWNLLAAVLLVGMLAWPYAAVFRSTYQPGYFIYSSPWKGWIFPLLGAHHMSSIGLWIFYGGDWLTSAKTPWNFILIACCWITALAYLATWIGMIFALPAAWRVWIKRQNDSVRDQLVALAMAIWICQTFLDGIERAYEFPHYHSATWIAYAVFAWLTVDALPRKGWTRLLLPAYAASLLVIIVFAMIRIHINGGTRTHSYGPTIANQQAIVDEISKYPPASVIDAQFRNWVDFDIAYRAIEMLRPSATRVEGRPKRLVVRYRNEYPEDARIVLDVLNAPATRPGEGNQ